MNKMSKSYRLFYVLDMILLLFLTIICVLPFINVVAISLSSSAAVGSGMVSLLPVDFSLYSFRFVLAKPELYKSFIVSVKRVLIGVPVNMIFTMLVAYPLSKETSRFRARNFFSWYFVVTMLFSGGLVAWYMTILKTGIINTLAALILPGAVPVFNVLILMNFFRGIPRELEEAAMIDGESQWGIMLKIYVPLSIPCIATLTLFCVVSHWNQWFDGIMLMSSPGKYPLQSYLQTVIVNRDLSLATDREIMMLAKVNDRTSRAAQVIIASVPMLILYPFAQRYFKEGIVLGSIKG